MVLHVIGGLSKKLAWKRRGTGLESQIIVSGPISSVFVLLLGLLISRTMVGKFWESRFPIIFLPIEVLIFSPFLGVCERMRPSCFLFSLAQWFVAQMRMTEGHCNPRTGIASPHAF